MNQAGFNVVRLAEFAWVFMEPEEGTFSFGWLDEALAVLRKEGINAILCTPTAVMPAWLARKYPEALAMQANGQRIVWGVRKNNCFTSRAYRSLSERVTHSMATHFRDTPNVIGWQTDNEFGEPVCYCETCQAEFRDWLRTKFETLDAFNKAMGAHFWGHIYHEWDEIVVPVDETSYSPSLCLEWNRFKSWLNVRFQRDQVKILRKICPHHFVTHNFMGLYNNLNYYDLAEDLDHVSWDNYPVWGKPEVTYAAAMAADVMRGLKRRNFWIMEQTAGPGGWGTLARNPRPGEMRKIAYEQVAHGADGMLWFRWRTCTAGREQYWHGILGHDNRPLRRYREISLIAHELHKLSKHIEGTTIKTDVAMIYDYDSQWALRIQPAYQDNNPHKAMHRYYNPLFRAGIAVDMIKTTEDFSKYRVVIAPDLYVLPDSIARALSDFVKNGGVLVTDCRTGVKNETSLCHDRTLPGLLSEATGIAIEEYEALAKDMEYPVVGAKHLSGKFTAIDYVDWVSVTSKTTDILAAYDQWHMKKFAAAVRNRFGKGTAYYIGTVIKEESFYNALMNDVLRTAGIKALLNPPDGVEVTTRQGKGKKLLFLVNHTEESKVVHVPRGKRELISGNATTGRMTLDAYGVAVVKL
jgi:beta-galactosidase